MEKCFAVCEWLLASVTTQMPMREKVQQEANRNLFASRSFVAVEGEPKMLKER